MSFQFSDCHLEDYGEQGYTIFRGIIPPTLIDDLREVCEKGREVARREDAQSQRFRLRWLDKAEWRAFEYYRDLPELRDALARVLGLQINHVDFEFVDVLIEPGDLPYCTAWHRDWRDNIKGIDLAQWESVQNDREIFNQVNCPLYEDSCTWIVPGSHNRRDSAQEIERFPDRPGTQYGVLTPELEGKSAAQRERLCLEYSQSMPNAMQVFLNAGDFMLYRNTLWHLGNYLPYKRRSTIHGALMTPRYKAFWDQAVEQAGRVESGAEWENPNSPAAEGGVKAGAGVLTAA